MADRVRITWNGEQVKANVDKAMDKGVQRAAILLASEMTRIMGSEGGGVKGLKPGEVNRSRKRNRYYPSPPGSAPGVRTGRLRNSITWQRVKQGVYRAGTNVKYGRFLDRGTSRMLARPWALRTFNRNRGRMVQVAAKTAGRELALSGSAA